MRVYKRYLKPLVRTIVCPSAACKKKLVIFLPFFYLLAATFAAVIILQFNHYPTFPSTSPKSLKMPLFSRSLPSLSPCWHRRKKKKTLLCLVHIKGGPTGFQVNFVMRQSKQGSQVSPQQAPERWCCSLMGSKPALWRR